MKVSCPSCQTNYNIDDKRIPPVGAKLKCAKCQTTFPIKAPAAAPEAAAPAAVPLPGGAPIPLPGARPAPAAGPAIPLPGAPAAPAFSDEPYSGLEEQTRVEAPSDDLLRMASRETPPRFPPPASDSSFGDDPGFSSPDSDFPPAESTPAPSPAPEEDMAMKFEDPLPQAPSVITPPPADPLLDFGSFPAAPPPEDAGAFGPDFEETPSKAPSPPPAGAPALDFGEVDFASPSADAFDLAPVPPPELAAPPAPEQPAAPADGLEMLNFIDEAAKHRGPTPQKKAPRYHIRKRSGKVVGPFDEGVVVKMLEEGQVLGNEDVSTDGENWTGVGTVPAFAQVIQKLMSSPAAGPASPPASGAATNAQSMERLKHLYEGRMAAVAVVSHKGSGQKIKRKLPLIIGAVAVVAVLAAGFGMGLTRYGVFGLKKLFPARITAGTPEDLDVMAARRALLADTYRSYLEARDLTARVLSRREYPDARATWCQAVFYLQRRYATSNPQDTARATAALEEIELLGSKNAEGAKAQAGYALVRKSPADALLILQQAKSRPENEGDIELDLLTAEAHAAMGDSTSARNILNRAIARDKSSAKALHALGNLHQAAGEADEAIKAYQSALEADPKHAVSAVELAAVELLVRKDIPEGVQALERALAEEVKSLLGPAELGRALALQGVVFNSQFKPKEAIASLEEALRLDSESTFTKGLLARVLLAQREYERALPLYKEATTREPQQLDYNEGYLTALVATGKMDEARNAVAAANTRFPGNARIAYLHGQINDALNNTKDAEANFKRALATDPGMVDAYLALGQLYLRLKRPAEAQPLLEQALAKAPDNPHVHNSLADLALAAGDRVQAQKEFDQAVALDPSLAEAHLGLSKVALANGDLETARVEVDRALELTAHLREGRLQRGLVMWKQGQLESAVLELSKAKDEDPRSAKIAATLGGVKLDQGDLPGAEAALLAALNSEPSLAEANYYMAIVKARRAEYTQAIESMSKALDQAPNLASYHYQMGLIYREAKRAPEAIEEWKVAIKQEPGYADAHEALGQVYLERNDLESAVKSFETALKVDPKRARILGFIGDSYVQAAKWSQAIASYQAALRADATLMRLYYKMGKVYSEMGDQNRAIEWFQRATKLEPNNPMSYYYLGFAYKERGRKQDAMAAFKMYLQKKPEAEDKKEIEDEIYYLGQ